MPYSASFPYSNQPLTLLVLVLSNTLIISGNEVNISLYYITNPDIFTGGNSLTECNISSPGEPPLIGCLSNNSPRLTDGVTGEGSPLNTDQFVGWDSNNQGTFIIAPNFKSAIPPRQLDIYFHNNPAMGTGLPPVVLLDVSYIFPTDIQSVGPIHFTYANNQHLSQSDSDTTMISVIITEDYEAEAIQLPYHFSRLHFDFSSYSINQALISEIKVYTEAVNVITNEIKFLPGVDEIELRTDNLVSSVRLSCTVANEGSFSWSWTGPNETALDTSHTSVFMADLTRTSDLEINNLSLSDAGQYTCTASVFDGHEADTGVSASRNIDIVTSGSVITNGPLISEPGEQNVSLKCEFSGLIPQNYQIQWKGPQGIVGMVPSDQHTIVNADSMGQSQSGGDSPGPSVLSTLTISTVEEEDNGAYTCLMAGSNNTQLTGSIQLSVLLASRTSTASPTSKAEASPSMTLTPESSSRYILKIVLPLILILVITIITTALVTIVLYLKYRKRKYELSEPPLSPTYAEIEPRLVFSASQPSNSSGYATIDYYPGSAKQFKPFTAELVEMEHSPQPLHSYLEPVKLMKRPNFLQENVTYSSGDEVDGNYNDPSAGSKEVLLELDSASHDSSDHQLPAIPSFHGTPANSEVSLYSEDLNPELIRQSYVAAEEGDQSLCPFASIYANIQPQDKRKAILEVKGSNIREIKELGAGQFGKVALAYTVGLSLKQLKLGSSEENVNVVVAIKRLTHGADTETQDAFEKEVQFMSRLDHKNVVRLLGVCHSSDSFLMVEYVEDGNLNDFLQDRHLDLSNSSHIPDNSVTPSTLISMCLQIASGMRYLASLHYIHRDLATRNCLIHQDFTVKIADFGMSRSLYESHYYQVKGRVILPIRWMANECFYGRFSEKSDVWAFGVTMWEIFTLGKVQPYEALSNQEVIDNAVMGPDRVLLHQPDHCPNSVYDIMKKCWIHEPDERAKFREIHHLLSKLHMCNV